MIYHEDELKMMMTKKGLLLSAGCCALNSLIHFPFVGCSSASSSSSSHQRQHQHQHRKEGRLTTQVQSITHIINVNDNNTPLQQQQQMSAEMTLNVTIHGLVLWASMGFLLPLAILIIRMSHHTQHQSPTKLKLHFYLHLILQVLSVLLATVGAIMSLRSFENTFNNKHQKIGLALYFAIWAQAIIGFCRPHKGCGKRRSLWYFTHWILGTIICLVGIINIYTGLQAYEKKRRKTSSEKTVKLWTILFTAQLIFMACFYVFQDKWDYIQRQAMPTLTADERPILRITNSVITDHPQQQTSSEMQRNTTTATNGEKDFVREPCPKANALKNLFQ